MALLFMDGFDHYTSTPDIFNKWTAYSYTPYFSPSYRRLDTGEGLRMNTYLQYMAKDFTASSTVVVGFALNLQGIPLFAANRPLLALDDTAFDYQVSFSLGPDFKISAYRDYGGTLLGTSDAAFTATEEWKYLEFKTVIHNSAGSIQIRSNETTILNLTGIDTQNTVNASADRLLLRSVYNTTAYYDDFYLDDANMHGDVRVHTFHPDANGTYTDFTPSAGTNYECVDEDAPDGDATYVASSTLGHKDTYTITTGSLYTVKGMQLTNYLRKDDAGVRKVKPICRSSSTDYQGDEVDITTSFKGAPQIWETDPADSNPWTQTKLEAAEFGLEITT